MKLEEEAKAFKASKVKPKEAPKRKDLTPLDFFAGQAMTGLLAGTNSRAVDLDYLKEESYRIAEKFIE